MKKIVDYLKNQPPEFKNPEQLTVDIISAINDPLINQSDDKIIHPKKKIILIQRILAAASITLILVFGVEQYIILEKISKLENQAKMISAARSHPVGLNLINISLKPGFDDITINNIYDVIKKSNRVLKSKVALAQLNAYEMRFVKRQKFIQLTEWNRIRTLRHHNITKPDGSKFHNKGNGFNE